MTRAARVVPDVATFAVDDGFWYSIPDHLETDLSVGSIVRVPLSGRRVRGWVVEVGERDSDKLKDIAAISGATPVFESRLLQSLLWAANHYVAPTATLLARATPPNLPRKIPSATTVPSGAVPSEAVADHPVVSLAERSSVGKRSPITAYLGPWFGASWLPALDSLFAGGRSVLVIVASRAEVDVVSSEAKRLWGKLVVAVTGEDDATDTRAWEAAQSPPRLVIGTPKTATWQIDDLALSIVLEESRRAMKDRQTPTLHVRDVMRTRSRTEGFNLAFIGPTPGVELLASGAEMVHVGNRAWPLVEVVDRSEESISDGFLSNRAIAALKATVADGGAAFVYTHRRVGSAATRCAACRQLRMCQQCGRRLGRVETCPKCQATAGPCARCGGVEFEELGTIPQRLESELQRKLGDVVAIAPEHGRVTVGTERDLATLDQVNLAVAADIDGMLVGSGYRTEEDALRQLARLATKVAASRGSRLMLQTARSDSFLVATMRRGDPVPYLERVLVDRGRDGLPPATSMLALEVRGEPPDDIASQIEEIASGEVVFGPMVLEDGRRWLLVGHLTEARRKLRKTVGGWRDKGAVVRIDADPIDV